MQDCALLRSLFCYIVMVKVGSWIVCLGLLFCVKCILACMPEEGIVEVKRISENVEGAYGLELLQTLKDENG